MIKWLGYKQVKVSSIVLPGGISARQKQPHVKELAASIRELGDEPINCPTVHAKTKKLIAGGDRMAAVMLNKSKKLWVRFVEADEQGVLDIEVDENLHRRTDNRDDLIARKVRRVAESLEREAEATGQKTSRAVSDAREKVARQIRGTAEAVRSAERRSRAKEDEPDEPTEPQPVNQAPPVITWGVPVDHLKEEFGAIRLAQVALKETDRHLRNAQRSLSALMDGSGNGGTIGGSIFHRLSIVHEAADTVRRTIPDALCPYCKGLLHRRPTCGGCGGFGYVNNDALDGVAAELLRVGPDAVVVDGKGGFIPVAAAKAVKARPAKKLDVRTVQPDGTEVPFDADAGDLF